MGQQQLILLVLATVIVGIAIVVGIAAFTENSAKANADAMMQDAVRIANDAQAWKKKPAPFGGQASVATAAQVNTENDFTGMTVALLGYPVGGTALTTTNLNGTFVLTAGTDPSITGTNAVEGNIIGVRLCGMDAVDVRGAVLQLNGEPTTPATLAACPTP